MGYTLGKVGKGRTIAVGPSPSVAERTLLVASSVVVPAADNAVVVVIVKSRRRQRNCDVVVVVVVVKARVIMGTVYAGQKIK